MIQLPKDLLTQNYTKPRVFLCEVDKTQICQLETTNLQGTFKFNAYSEISFTIGRMYTNIVTGKTSLNPFYDKIEALRLVYLEGFGYFEIQDPEVVSDGIQEIKNVTAYSLEYTLSQKYLEEFNINTGDENSVEVIYSNGTIVPVTLYNIDRQELSLLHIVLEKIYGWKIGYVDPSLKTMSRMFEISRVSVYDFIVQDICEKFNCFVVFDTIENTINFYPEALITKFIGDGSTASFIVSPAYDSIGSVSINSYKTTEYTYEITGGALEEKKGIVTLKTPPEKGAVIEVIDNSQKQWVTDVYVSFKNLAQEVNVSYSADDIKTVLTVKGSDDLDIREVNGGLPYIVDISYYHSPDWMGQELYDIYTDYLHRCDELYPQYTLNSTDIWKIESNIIVEEQRLSLKYELAKNITSNTVGKYYIRGGTEPYYYYTEVSLPDQYNAYLDYYTLPSVSITTTKVWDLYEALIQYFKSQEEKDIAALSNIKDDFSFVKNYTVDKMISDLSSAKTTEQKNTFVLSFLDEMWDQLGQNPLNFSYYGVYNNTLLQLNKEVGINNPSNENYWKYHTTNLMVQSLDKEIDDRKESIKKLETERDTKNKPIIILLIVYY